MPVTLGIHVGHHASCAVVKDGKLVAAIQLERRSRRKYHVVGGLSDVLPIEACLRAAGLTMADVDLVVSSFQGGSVASHGLQQRLVEPGFAAFDPWAARHLVLSHHQAHAYCGMAYASQGDKAVLVCDYSGSSSVSGLDYALPFARWYEQMTSSSRPVNLKSECMSIYRASANGELSLVDREYVHVHNSSGNHVYSVATLYENVSQALFHSENAHGQLMALAAYGAPLAKGKAFRPIVDIEGDQVSFRNDWQEQALGQGSSQDQAMLAHRCQEATTAVLLAYARRARRLVGSSRLCVAGGTFLNILGNSALAESGIFAEVAVPSAPHDAGIAVGCAFYGSVQLGDGIQQVRSDRLGEAYGPEVRRTAVEARSRLVESRPVGSREVAGLLAGGAIIARAAGRAEFGPRALGARSLLASPLLAASKERLNVIKGRQDWRPVAPITPEDKIERCFTGPAYSPWMTFSHEVVPAWKERLPALFHPDGSTRAQTLARADDPALCEILDAFEAETGVAVLVNTSLNGPGEPILETPEQAIQWFLQHRDVDALLLEDELVTRTGLGVALRGLRVSWHPAAILSLIDGGEGNKLGVCVLGRTTVRLSERMTRALIALSGTVAAEELGGSELGEELYELLVQGVLLEVVA